jgi:hypothetical protein
LLLHVSTPLSVRHLLINPFLTAALLDFAMVKNELDGSLQNAF